MRSGYRSSECGEKRQITSWRRPPLKREYRQLVATWVNALASEDRLGAPMIEGSADHGPPSCGPASLGRARRSRCPGFQEVAESCPGLQVPYLPSVPGDVPRRTHGPRGQRPGHSRDKQSPQRIDAARHREVSRGILEVPRYKPVRARECRSLRPRTWPVARAARFSAPTQPRNVRGRSANRNPARGMQCETRATKRFRSQRTSTVCIFDPIAIEPPGRTSERERKGHARCTLKSRRARPFSDPILRSRVQPEARQPTARYSSRSLSLSATKCTLIGCALRAANWRRESLGGTKNTSTRRDA